MNLKIKNISKNVKLGENLLKVMDSFKVFGNNSLKTLLDKRIYIIIMFILMSLSIVAYHNYVANHSVYAADDFVHYIQMRNVEGFNEDNNLGNGIAYARWHLNVWGGVYFGMFLHGAIGINNKVRDLTNLHFWMSVNVILYFASVFMFFISLVSNIIMKEKAFIEKLTVSSVLSFVFILLFNGFN
ncbi:MAG: hypothetical protein IJ593_01930, partial [Lachnospiraceae bacterium]|nr:hypothetical protein [Lachnospiraceae bacterium]